MTTNMMESLECGICMTFATDALETSCCHRIFCSNCLAQLRNKTCPMCRKENFQSVESHLARRLINELPVKCQFCEKDVTRGNLQDHEIRCSNRIIKCPAENCNHSSKRSEFFEHIVNVHGDQLLENVTSIFRRNPVQSAPNGRLDPICKRRNANGREARLGETGKYYCRGPLSCNCCDGHCGPANGCNCAACMKLDIAARYLPKTFLVNREGVTARKGITGLYYCGRLNMVGAYDCDGYCGPTDGPNCAACKKLDVQALGRYAEFL